MWRSDWRHCPRCSAPLTHGAREGEDKDVLHCPACGLVIYDNPAPTASALVMRDGRLMLTRRARPPAAGLWDIPGGFVDPGEHPRDTVRRELSEETGLDVEVGDELAIVCDRYGDDGPATLNIFYLVTVTGGTEEAADDVSEIGWFGLDELPSPEEFGFQNSRDAVAALVDRTQRGNL